MSSQPESTAKQDEHGQHSGGPVFESGRPMARNSLDLRSVRRRASQATNFAPLPENEHVAASLISSGDQFTMRRDSGRMALQDYTYAPMPSSMGYPYEAGPSMPPKSPPKPRSPSRTKSVSSSRRPSLLHELHLQPSSSSRPLSPHQILLLTPFGKPISPPPAMTRSNNRQADDQAPPVGPRGYHRHRGSAPVVRYNPGKASQLGTSPTTSRRTSTNFQREMALEPANHQSPQQPGDAEAAEVPLMVHVPMTRCLSLPILTLREVEAMKQKEMELGIERSQGFAWVSGGLAEDDDQSSSSARGSMSTSSGEPLQRLVENTASYSPPMFADPFRRGSLVSALPSTSTPFMDPFAQSRRASLANSNNSANSGYDSERRPSRPAMMRYQSSPARLSHGGLNIEFGDDVDPLTRDVSPGDGRRGSVLMMARQPVDGTSDTISQSVTSTTSSTSSTDVLAWQKRIQGATKPSESSFRSRNGSWASVKLLDRAAAAESATTTASSPVLQVGFDARPASVGAGRGSFSSIDGVLRGDRVDSVGGLEWFRRSSLGREEETVQTMRKGSWPTFVTPSSGGDWQERRGSWGTFTK